MAYTPELYPRGSATLRRLAWFRGKPMSKSLEILLELTGRKTDSPVKLVFRLNMQPNRENRSRFTGKTDKTKHFYQYFLPFLDQKQDFFLAWEDFFRKTNLNLGGLS